MTTVAGTKVCLAPRPALLAGGPSGQAFFHFTPLRPTLAGRTVPPIVPPCALSSVPPAAELLGVPTTGDNKPGDAVPWLCPQG